VFFVLLAFASMLTFRRGAAPMPSSAT
jgi:hypothetical protein